MRTFTMGDIHGMYDQLIGCLKLVNFDYENDTLIQLGDVVDRGPKSYECIEELMKIKHLIAIQGNHDACWFDYLKTGNDSVLWNQGAMETYQSYIDNDVNPEVHFDFFNQQVRYCISEDNDCFIHGGFDRHKLLSEEIDTDVFLWDRDLLGAAMSYSSMKNNTYPFKMKDGFKRVFIGHTPVQYFGHTTPQRYANIWNLDTGCGKGINNKLTIMNVDTEEYWQY